MESKRGGSERVDVSERDLDVLRWCNEQKFLTRKQVGRWFPDGKPNPKARRVEHPEKSTLKERKRPGSYYMRTRLKKLVRYGVLERVHTMLDAASVYIPGEIGHDILVAKGLDAGLKRLSKIDIKLVYHDQMVTDVRWQLERELACVEAWKPERVLWREYSTQAVADAAFTSLYHGREIALEVELTSKSMPRYQVIFSRYAKRKYDLVLYMVAAESQMKSLLGSIVPKMWKKQIDKYKKGGGPKPNAGRFLFCALPEFFAAGLEARLFCVNKPGASEPYTINKLRDL